MRTAEYSFRSRFALGEPTLMPLVDIATPLLDTLQQVDSLPKQQSVQIPDSVSKLAFELINAAQEDAAGLASDLHRSFLQSAPRLNRVSLAVTGLSWLGAGVQSVQQECLSIIRSAHREITLCAYSLTSGAGTLIDEIGDVAGQGVIVTLIINNVKNQPADIRGRIRKWSAAVPTNIRLFDFNTDDPQHQLHAKVITADRTIALIGSANLSFHGMVSNHELAVVLRGPIAEEIAVRLDTLKTNAKEIDPGMI
jgi:phosphatidylserine/phosphatidylglycerophosphate/cardiolipin synthase-like enzyme